MPQKTSKTKQETRYTIRGDNDGHKYFIPVGEENAFDAWVLEEETIGEVVSSYGLQYNDNRIDGRFTFTDPRNE